jgi:putative hemolysin
MANPASVNCGQIGGTTEIKTAADGGQYGMCTFANGTTCEEWALFRGEGCQPYAAPETTTVSP